MVSMELYKEEVKALTELFRNEWEDIQGIAIANGLDSNSDFLLSFIEDEDESVTCLFFSKKKGLFLYESIDKNINFKFVEKADIESEFPQVQVLGDISNFYNW